MSGDYQGWTNYETWWANMLISNDAKLHEMALTRAKQFLQHRTHPLFDLADRYKQWFDAMKPQKIDPMWDTLLDACLESVNWRELSQHWLDKAAEGSISSKEKE